MNKAALFANSLRKASTLSALWYNEQVKSCIGIMGLKGHATHLLAACCLAVGLCSSGALSMASKRATCLRAAAIKSVDIVTALAETLSCFRSVSAILVKLACNVGIGCRKRDNANAWMFAKKLPPNVEFLKSCRHFQLLIIEALCTYVKIATHSCEEAVFADGGTLMPMIHDGLHSIAETPLRLSTQVTGIGDP
jgi:hypothetical protein